MAAAGSEVTIHVHDEARKVNKDFSCPRKLLTTEMGYFKDNLPCDARQWEDIDIAVHCDVQIFDWLMHYVHRNQSAKDSAQYAKAPHLLEPGNVVSILISSDFLKMPSLVNKCIEFCHRNLSRVLAIPCNMNCISDVLVMRIADQFELDELEAVKDPKDKLKSRLFTHKLQDLFASDFTSPCSPSNASQLFRCSFCNKLLVPQFQSATACIGPRATVDRHGNIAYKHARDPTWNATAFVAELKSETSSWRDVFWRVWGYVNHLVCTMCHETFACANYNQCRYHPDVPCAIDADVSYPRSESAQQLVYPCCRQVVCRFQPLGNTKGCAVRPHQTKTNKGIQGADSGDMQSERVISCLEVVKDLFSAHSFDTQHECDALVPLISHLLVPHDECSSALTLSQSHVTTHSAFDTALSSSPAQTRFGRRHPPRASRLRLISGGRGPNEDEDVPDERDGQLGVIITQLAKGKQLTVETSWDASLPTRLNQDVQRAEDGVRMTDLCNRLSGRNNNTNDSSCHVLNPATEDVEGAGGLYHRLETALVTQRPPLSSQSSRRP